ncbi:MULTISPECIES: hypothetical protein [Lysinibacillus]|uniref:hypothetical protein n=1 Tax=Lysinibacillus TaxID=400634 RepID=UPI0021A881D5|nr:hypothetical protein [Lysinibacillus capsici]MCT1538433.1 hypothetical protein [Lysinibacillus capsici]MCT1569141.1 hypothetical protein [Lysinibacillus capsici]MCT1646156.1 hypothetical protein [Lysinibacillus capsici]MCT1725338.1 hypothetical protein [Lysinibacillus capsici]MCT1784118.1 hypothetical protein [Lysinibacillus capsici]
MKEVKLTELELIKLTMSYGFNGSELNNPHFIEKGFLKNNGSYQSFTKKIDAICESWEKLRKKKGEPTFYLIRGLKEKADKTVDNRKFNGYDDRDYLISKHVFNRLVEMDDSSVKSAYEWSIDCNAFNPVQISKEMIRIQFHDLYMDEDSEHVYNGFQRYIKNNNRSMIDKAFKYLEHENLIKVTNHYSAVKLDNQSVEIDKNTYDTFTFNKTVILKKYDVSAYVYKYLINNEKYTEMFEELEQLYDEMKMKLVYVSHSVEILNTNIFHEIETEDFYNAYYSRLIEKVNKLESKSINAYANLYSSFKSYSLLSTLSIVIEDNKRLNQLIESKRPDYFAVYLILNDRYQKGIKMSDRFYQELDEMELMLSGTAISKKETQDEGVPKSTVEKARNIVPTPLTIDDTIEPYTYIPVDNFTYEKDTPKETIHNNKELANAVDMIKLAFSKPMSQTIAVGSF